MIAAFAALPVLFLVFFSFRVPYLTENVQNRIRQRTDGRRTALEALVSLKKSEHYRAPPFGPERRAAANDRDEHWAEVGIFPLGPSSAEPLIIDECVVACLLVVVLSHIE